SAGGKQPNSCDGVLGFTVGFLITHHHVVARFTLEHLAHSVPAHGRLDGVLYVGHIDSKTRCLLAVDDYVKIRLAEIAQELDVMHAGDGRHDVSDFFALLLESLQVVPENL